MSTAATEPAPDIEPATVRADSLRGIDVLIRELGGDPHGLLGEAGVDLQMLARHGGRVPHQRLVEAMELAAERLGCPDFGMRLAVLQASTKKPGGPLEVAMRHSRTVGDAFRYSADHIRAYTNTSHLIVERDEARGRLFVRLEVMLPEATCQRQAVENALLSMQYNVAAISGGRVKAHEARFVHEAQAPAAAYRVHFGCPARFGQTENGLLFDAADFDLAIEDADPRLYEMADTCIRHRTPATEPALAARVRVIVERQLLARETDFGAAAGELGLHPRTLQRRLKAEGVSFETIKDNVRRDLALRYLRQSQLPFGRLAEMLGYSETSVLSRSCHRWFAASPRQLRSSS